MVKKNSLSHNIFLYMIGNFGSKILNFILVPLYTYYIPVGEMGTYDIYYTTVTLLIPLVTISISESVYRWLVDEKTDADEVVSIAIKIAALSLIIFTFFYWMIYVTIRFDYYIYLYLMVILSSIYGLFLNIIRGMKKNSLYALLGVLHTFLILVFNILFLVIFQSGICGLLEAQVLGYAILTIITISIVFKSLGIRINFKNKNVVLQKEMIDYAWPLIPNSVNWWITNLSDRYMIRYILGVSSNGIYAVSCKFPGIIDSFVGLFSMAWQEDAICSFESGVDSDYFSEIYDKYYTFLLTMISCGMPVTYYYITFFMERAYQTAWRYIPFLYIGTVFHALANYLSVGYNINKDTKWVTLTSFFAAITNIIINFIFMRNYGIQVASVSTMVSYMLIFIIRYYTTRNIFKLRIKYLKFICLIAYVLFVLLILFLESNIFNLITIFCSTIVFLVVNKEILLNMLRKLVKACICHD